MTLPALAGASEQTTLADTLPLHSPPAPDAADRIRAVLAADVSPRAFRLYAAAVLTLPAGQWHSTAELARAASISEHGVRPLVAELVNAGFMAKAQKSVRVRGEAVIRNRYFILAATAVTP